MTISVGGMLRQGLWSAEPRRKARPDATNDEWTTHDICLGVKSELWWDETLPRQVRRALDSLHRQGLVEKRLVPNTPHYPHATVALWKLTQP